MFTGIIENTGIIKDIRRKQNGIKLFIETKDDLVSQLKKGGSIAVNGVCLTVTDFNKTSFFVDVVKDTLDITTLSLLKRGETINLELPLKLGDRLEGHILEGHIDGIGEILSIVRGGLQTNVKIKVPHRLSKYIVENGSVGIDGISLTVKEMKNNILKITMIPFTIENTNFKQKKTGLKVNIEVDRTGKYIEKYLKRTS